MAKNIFSNIFSNILHENIYILEYYVTSLSLKYRSMPLRSCPVSSGIDCGVRVTVVAVVLYDIILYIYIHRDIYIEI
jgi:hypothetical protein